MKIFNTKSFGYYVGLNDSQVNEKELINVIELGEGLKYRKLNAKIPFYYDNFEDITEDVKKNDHYLLIKICRIIRNLAKKRIQKPKTILALGILKEIIEDEELMNLIRFKIPEIEEMEIRIGMLEETIRDKKVYNLFLFDKNSGFLDVYRTLNSYPTNNKLSVTKGYLYPNRIEEKDLMKIKINPIWLFDQNKKTNIWFILFEHLGRNLKSKKQQRTDLDVMKRVFYTFISENKEIMKIIKNCK